MRQGITPWLWLRRLDSPGMDVEMTPCMALEDLWI